MKDEATRYRSARIRLSYLAQDRLHLAETVKHLAPRTSEPREFDFVPLKTCSAVSGWETQSCSEFSKT